MRKPLRGTGTPKMRIAAAALACWSAAACGRLGGGEAPSAPTPLTPATPVLYTAIGASDALGIGSSAPCAPFVDCPNGMGYPQIVLRALKARGFTATLSNLGIPTAVIGPDFEALGQQYHRYIAANFIDREMPFVQAGSTLVTIFAGGNEVNTVTAALGAGAGGADPAGYIDRQVAAFAADYRTLIDGIRSRAAGARLIALNVPNLAGAPYLAGASEGQKQAAQRLAVGMTAAINAFASRNVAVIDLMCDPRTYQASTYSSDGFHPSDAGYAFIAGEIVSAALDPAYPPPRAGCPQNTLVPGP